MGTPVVSALVGEGLREEWCAFGGAVTTGGVISGAVALVLGLRCGVVMGVWRWGDLLMEDRSRSASADDRWAGRSEVRCPVAVMAQANSFEDGRAGTCRCRHPQCDRWFRCNGSTGWTVLVASPMTKDSPMPRTRPIDATGAARVFATLVVGVVVALSGCATSTSAPASNPADPPAQGVAAAPSAAAGEESVRTLAKVDGWREGLTTPPQVHSVLEVAYDAESAQRLWEENLPPTLVQRTGEPLEPGRYGDLADVDLDDRVLALWSGGQSGGCPGWVDDVHLDDAGVVVVSERLASRAPVASDGSYTCSSDWNSYRTVIVIDRAALPGADEIATVQAKTTSGFSPSAVHLATYPAA